jgi:hypothetical protein
VKTIFKLLAIVALLAAGIAIGAPGGQVKSDLPGAPQVHSPKTDDWQSVNVPPNMDGTMYAYDRNSIEVIRGSPGEMPEVELAVVVTRGDKSILGKHARFSFFCDGSLRFRVNGSYPVRVPDLSQEYQLANIACAAARRL